MFEPDNEELIRTPYFSRTTLALLLVMLAFASLIACGFEPALIFQPTVVGIIWGHVFLIGYLLSGVGRGSAWYLLLAAPIVYCSNSAFDSLCELGEADSVLVTATLLLAGWATCLFDPESRIRSSSQPTAAGTGEKTTLNRWSIWDIGFVTLVAACFVKFWQQAEASSMLMLAVFAALIGGVLCSWIACRLVWKDDWSFANIAVLIATLLSAVVVVAFSSPLGLPLASQLSWALSGPLNVMASQGTVVLGVLACWRFDRIECDRKIAPTELKVFQ